MRAGQPRPVLQDTAPRGGRDQPAKQTRGLGPRIRGLEIIHVPYSRDDLS